MSLDSTVKKALLVGAFSTAIFLNPLSQNYAQAQTSGESSGYYSDKDIADLLAAMDKKERESHITLEDKAYDDQWMNRMIAEIYFPLSKKYDADTTNAIIRGYAHMGVDDGSNIFVIKRAADDILSDPYIKTMPKEIANSIIIATGFWTPGSRTLIEYARTCEDSLKKKGIDSKKNPSDLCAIIEARGGTYSPSVILSTYLSYDAKPIDQKDFIKAYGYSMYVLDRPAGIVLTKKYMLNEKIIHDIGTSLINDFGISVPLAGKLLQVAAIAELDLPGIIDLKNIFRDLPKKYNEGIIGDMLLPYQYSVASMNKKRLAENFVYVFDSLTDRGFDEKTVRAMIQSYTINPVKK